MTTFNLAQFGHDLGTRQLGGEIRDKLTRTLGHPWVLVDCAGVEMVTHSFADEVFGKLIKEIGPHTFQETIRFANVAPQIAPIIRFVLKERLAELRDGEQAARW